MLCVTLGACVQDDAKSRIQALDRTQPGLPLRKGRAATSCRRHASSVMMTHDYKRNGTATLFAVLDVKSGMVIGDCMSRPRAEKFLIFLRNIDKAVPARRDVHLLPDNYAAHNTPEVKAWLDKHPRFRMHFTPTSASWLNLVERVFAEITSRRIRRGGCSSVGYLEVAIHDYLARRDEKPKPFEWTKSAEDILDRQRRALDALDEIRGNR
ncbi:IS630 family transposase [Roseovarius sp. D22-M7]|uniref:IS630 family transposase n=1 Tax=Roseovarius sp. D22-M7 TaxID=3127116 RepID=UPI0030105708